MDIVSAVVGEYDLILARWNGDNTLKCEVPGHGSDSPFHWGEIKWSVKSQCPTCNNIFYSKKTCCEGWADACKKQFGSKYPVPCVVCGLYGTVEDVLTIQEET